ncbi:hypothetical protein SprV_0802491100 [Sparganum proliferum]
MRTHESGIDRSPDTPTTSNTSPAPSPTLAPSPCAPITTTTTTASSVDDTDAADFSCPHCPRTFTSRIGLDLTSVFQTWAKTGLTESFKRSSKTRPFEQKKDVDELIKIMRKNKSVDPPSSWDTRNRRWWSAVTSNKFSEMSQLLVEDSTLIRWKSFFVLILYVVPHGIFPTSLQWTALHYAAKDGNLRSLDLLVKQYRADVNVQSKGSTPLHIAVAFSQRLFIRCLLEVYRARNDVMDYSGRFPLHLLSPELAPEFQALLSSGRLARIRDSLSILLPKRQSTSRNSIIAATTTIQRLAGKVASKHNQDIGRHSATHLLLSSLPSANGSCQPMQNVIHRLRHGLPFHPVAAAGDENVRPATASHKSKASTVRARPRRLSHTSSLRSLTNGWSAMRQSHQPPPPPQGSRPLTFPRTASMGPETYPNDVRRHTLLLEPTSSHSTLYNKRAALSDAAPVESAKAKFAVPRKASVFRRKNKKSSAVTGSGPALESLLPPVPKADSRRARSTCLLSRQSSISTSSDLAKSPSSDSSFSGFGSSVEPPDLLTGCLEAVANRPQLSLFAVPRSTPPSERA